MARKNQRIDGASRRGQWSEEILQEGMIRIQAGKLENRQNDIMESLWGVPVAELKLRTLIKPGLGP
jgi:hypothetical protein